MSNEPKRQEVSVNVAEPKQAPASIHPFSGRLIEAQEEERSKIGKELHDDICQSLAIIAYELDRLFNQLPEAARSKIQVVAEHIRLLTGHINRLSNQLHSLTLKDLGLLVALPALCADLAEDCDIRVQYRCAPDVTELDGRTALMLFRTAEEALRNIRRHSQAHQVCVELIKETGALLLRVSDDGVGFDPDVARAGTGLGLGSIEQRMQSIGGSLTIKTSPGHGTIIEARSPSVRVPASALHAATTA